MRNACGLKKVYASLLVMSVLGLSSCAWIKAGGTVTKSAGEGMTKASQEQEDDSFLGKLLRFGGSVGTAVGGAVEKGAEDEARRGKKNNKADSTKTGAPKTSSGNQGTGKAGSSERENDKPRQNGTITIKTKYQVVSVKSSDSNESETIGKVAGGEKLTKLGENASWVKVKLKDGREGWIYKSFSDDTN